jgi:hypothetical protein
MNRAFEPQKDENPLAGGFPSAAATKHELNDTSQIDESKRFATLQAQAASCGFVVATADDARGERVILASPWGECRVFRSVRELATFVEGLGGAR